MNDIPNVNPTIETLRTDIKVATNFVESFFSGKQQRAIKDDEERRDMLEKLMVAQKTVDDANRGDSIKSITDTINNHNKVYTDNHVLPSELFSNDELIAAVKAIKGIEVKALFSDEELAAAGYVKKEETKAPEVETIKYLTRDGKVLTTVLHGKKQFLEKNGYSADVIEFWNWTQDPTVAPTLTRPKDLGEGTTVQKVSRDYLKEVSDEKLKELCKAYYTAA